jgi:periplasmic divalent cation tolerance protein
MNENLVYITCGNLEEAEKIARALVEERLAACANLLPEVRSIYRWKEAIHSDPETVLIAKTRGELLDKLTARVLALHSYECPCVVAVPIQGGNPDFLNWIRTETQIPY